VNGDGGFFFLVLSPVRGDGLFVFVVEVVLPILRLLVWS
jgi:hypothetical protein